MAQVIARIPNAIQQERVANETVSRLQIPIFIMNQEIAKAQVQQSAQARIHSISSTSYLGLNAEVTAEVIPAEPLHAARPIEALLSLLLTNSDLVPLITRELVPAWLEGLDGAETLLQLLDAHAHDAWENATQFIRESDDRTNNYLAGLLLNPVPIPQEATLEEHAAKLIQNIEKQWKKQRLEILLESVKSGLLAPDETMSYLREIESIRRRFPDLKSWG